MWFGPMKRFQKLFFHTPLVNVFIAGSEAYHDYYRWPLKDKRTFENWKRETAWGRLFAAYERGEDGGPSCGHEPRRRAAERRRSSVSRARVAPAHLRERLRVEPGDFVYSGLR